jgi:hypothetical protein
VTSVQIETLYLPKRTGTYADAIAAFGLGHLAYLLSDEHPRLEDSGWCYTISWPSGPRHADSLDYASVRADPGYPYVMLRPDDAEAPPPGARIDYREQRERLLTWRKMRDDLRKARNNKLTPEDLEQLRQSEPLPNWMLYQDLNVLQAFGGYNSLHAAIRHAPLGAFAQSLTAKLEALAQQRDASEVDGPFRPKVTSVQAFNPTAGKGTNRPKPDGAGLAGLPSAYVDWFEEWLRFIGIGRAARAVNLGDDIKLITLAPANLAEGAAQAVHSALVNAPAAWTSAKVDLVCTLRLAEALIKDSGLLSGGSAEASQFFSDRSVTPRDVVAGMHTAYFTSLGSARALTNVGFIGLPGWFPVTTTTAGAWLDILSEHQRVLVLLDEEKSEEAALLLLYRDFLSGGEHDTASLLEFLGAYAVHVMRARARSRPVRPFTVANLRRLTQHMSQSYSTILDNDGFRAVAAAMRRSTVTEQYWKAQGRQQYEIHYGLFADIKRRAQFRDQLVTAIGEFINEYNAESARIEERAAGAKRGDVRHRPRVTTGSIEEFVDLLDGYKPEVVAMLLLAYASARDPRTPEAGSADQPNSDAVDDAPKGDEE